MQKFVIAGLIPPLAARVRSALKSADPYPWEGWEHAVEESNSHKAVALNGAKVAKLVQYAESGSRIFAFRPREAKDEARVHSALVPYFRFAWLPNRWLGYIPGDVPTFVNQMTVALGAEQIWLDEIQPVGTRSPLLLPEHQFSATGAEYRKIWNQALISLDRERVMNAARSIDEFQLTYWRKGADGRLYWIDDADRVFDHAGEMHGRAPHPRCWKYAFRLPDGFHYDVTTTHGRPFTMTDATGRTHRVLPQGHINVDPHGYVRSPGAPNG